MPAASACTACARLISKPLSKRKDPELSLDYYRKEGYHPAAVREYLFTVLNSDFEEWRDANPDAETDAFDFTTEKMSSSGTLFDLNKLNRLFFRKRKLRRYKFLSSGAAFFLGTLTH